MDGNISAQVIEEIRSRSDIVEVISRYIPLQAKGKNYYGSCPFHQEKTPSFAVNPEKQIYHCFGCGVGGDVFGFLMKKEGVSFVEAVELQAGKVGVIIPSKRQSPEGLQKLKDQQKLFEVNEISSEFFQQQLHNTPDGKKGLQYLEKRGISAKTQQQFKLGYAPSGWESLIKYMTAKRINPQMLERVGLAVKRENRDGYYDRFRDRVMFPIFDYRERLIGFGGRCFDEEKNPPKYMNSPETVIYHKGEGFYGLNWSKEFISKQKTAIIVEGYLDYISLKQAGIENVIAPLGTAFTQQQAQLISHYASELVLFFDADLAGRKAATRSFPLFVDSKARVKVAQLPVGHDPDTYVRHYGAQALNDLVAAAIPLVDFVLQETLKEENINTTEGQIAAANKVLPLLSQISNSLERSSYLAKVAQKLGLKEQLLLKELEKAVAKRQRTMAIDKEKVSPCSKAEQVAQEHMLILMLNDELFLGQGLKELEHTDFTDPDYKEIFLVLQKLKQENKKITGVASVLQELSGERARNFISKSAVQTENQPENAEAIFQDCLQNMISSRLRRQLQALRSKALTDRNVLLEYDKLLKQLKA